VALAPANASAEYTTFRRRRQRSNVRIILGCAIPILSQMLPGAGIPIGARQCRCCKAEPNRPAATSLTCPLPHAPTSALPRPSIYQPDPPPFAHFPPLCYTESGRTFDGQHRQGVSYGPKILSTWGAFRWRLQERAIA
jgi:hypothetical protein